MLEIILCILLSVGMLCLLLTYTKFRAEAKRDGFISDDYIENNDEEEEKDNEKK